MTTPDAPRPRRRRWWIAAAVPLFLVVVVAVALPFVLDVERHRGRIEAALAKATGWNVELGSIDLSVLHGLVLTVSPVTLAAPGDSSRFQAGKIAVMARWAPLIRGRLEIDRIELVAPDIRLVRPDEATGWVLPLPPQSPPSGAATSPGAGDGASAVSIARIDVSHGALRVVDRVQAPPLSLAVQDVEVEMQPATGRVSGSGELEGGAGTVRFTGSPDTGLDLDLENVTTDLFGPWVGEGVLHPGGRLDGKLTLDPSEGVSGKLIAESLKLLAGVRALPTTELSFALRPDAAAWRVERLTLQSGQASVAATGTVIPLALQLRLDPTPLAVALDLTEAVVPLGLDVTPPGSASLTARVDIDKRGALSYEAEGEVSAARFVAAELLPAATDVRAAFRLGRKGDLTLRILEGKVGGGPLVGEVRIDSIAPLGTLTFDGTLDGASLGTLLGGFVPRAPERLTGPANVRARLKVNLAAPQVDASALAGSIDFGAGDVALSGWDLESALRKSLQDKLGKLADVAALVDSDARAALSDEPAGGANPVSHLLDRLGAEVRLDRLPWSLSRLELSSGGITARGEGSFDPLAATVDLRFDAELDSEMTARYVGRYPQLRQLVGSGGHLRLPLRLNGSMMSPSVGVELSKLVPGQAKPKDAAEELLRGLIDKKLSKKP